MPKLKFELQTRVIKVMHPTIPDIILFEAVVRIANINKTFIKEIKEINIEYSMKHLKDEVEKTKGD